MSIKRDLQTLLNLHYIVNIVLCTSYILLKTIYPFCAFIFPASRCELDWREWEILMFLAVIIVFRTRRSGSTSMLAYLSSSFMYMKIANVILYFHSDPRLSICFAVLCLLQMLLLPEPAYKGPDHIVYFRGPNIWDEIKADKRVNWLITFYAPWSPPCATFATVFAKLSLDYHLDNLKFGKLDVAKYPAVAKEFQIDDSSFSRQLPTVILFKNGKEVSRRPIVDGQNRVGKFFFNQGNIQTAFDLNNLYEDCKKNPLKRRRGEGEGDVGDDEKTKSE
uniref:Thioredoxin domain-containing protein n=1 Tax=Strigamia maritima TaxID=126957 RepID=T1J6J3_STRMM